MSKINKLTMYVFYAFLVLNIYVVLSVNSLPLRDDEDTDEIDGDISELENEYQTNQVYDYNKFKNQADLKVKSRNHYAPFIFPGPKVGRDVNFHSVLSPSDESRKSFNTYYENGYQHDKPAFLFKGYKPGDQTQKNL
ncbi:uncharacterized protein LOC100192232 [Hydra vulgaris]|uniref:Uncharacterized protein LOC100192232 n=1 Tax=Hydra vulgaris TaxID=6087 RepID=A0ABM4CGZ0_HYDVU